LADSPLLGPNGQPISNPFFSQQNAKSDVSVNVRPAIEAFNDLQKVLDGVAKNFGSAFQNTIKNNLKDQEQFYKLVGDKENERRVNVDRLKRAAIDSVNEETKAQIAAFEQRAQAEKASSESISRGKLDLALKATKQISDIEAKAAANAKGPGILGRSLQGVQNVASRIGGPIGGLVSGAANIIAEPEVAIPGAIVAALLEATIQKSKNIKVGLQLAGAGAGPLSQTGFGAEATAQSLSDRVFGGISIAALGPSERRDLLTGMAQSRTLVGQAGTTAGASGLTGNLGLFANILPDASKEMELFTDATKNLGMSQRDISKTFFQTAKSSKDLQITQLDAISAQLEMQKALRNITNDGTVAANVLDTVGSFFRGIGKSEAETTRMTLGVASAGANLSLEKILGMSTFVNGKMPTVSDLFGTPAVGIGPNNQGTINNPFALMGNFLTKVGGQSKNPLEQIMMANQLNKDMGLGIQLQDLPQFFKMASTLGKVGGTKAEDFAKQTEEMAKRGKRLSIEGMEHLSEIVSPIQKMAQWTEEFFNRLEGVLSKYFGAPKGGPVQNPYTAKNIAPHNDPKKYMI
jgi:hypothetical protein